VHLVKGARTATNKDVNKAMDQKALKDWANETD
jgi:hypothetical protein